MMMPKQKLVKLAPLMSPNWAAVNPKSVPKLARIPPRMPKPMPAARMAKKPAQRSRFAFGAILLLFPLLIVLLFFCFGLTRNSLVGQRHGAARQDFLGLVTAA